VNNAVALLAGLVFGVGLLFSSMTQPEKVLGFLNVRAWDPTLMFVMGGAVVTYMLLIRRPMHRGKPWFDSELHLPTRCDIDLPLVAGAAIFGVGWGLAGYCPGPGIVSAAAGGTTALVFVAAMVAGMLIVNAIDRR
jgi:hypothetical protein